MSISAAYWSGDYNFRNYRSERLRTQVNLLGAWIDPLSPPEVVDLLVEWCKAGARRYVVTPNLDHCRRLRTNAKFAVACDRAGLSLPDGWPLVAASRVTGHRIERRVTGSDLVIPFCQALAENSLSVFLLGSSDEVLATSSKKLQEKAPGLVISGMYSPPFGFENDKQELEFINQFITEARPDALIVALGAPKQELWMKRHVHNLPIGVAIGVGGTLDFIAGKQNRAPQLMQQLGFEWLWRACSQPCRLGKRYLAGMAALPGLVMAHLYRHHIAKRDAVRHRPVS